MYGFAEVVFGCWVFSDYVCCCCGFDGLYPRLAGLRSKVKEKGHTTAGHKLVIAISFLPCLSKSIAKPFVSTYTHPNFAYPNSFISLSHSTNQPTK